MMLLRLRSLLSFQGNPMIFSSARRLRLTAFVPLFLFAPPVMAQAAPAVMAEARPETAAPDRLVSRPRKGGVRCCGSAGDRDGG